MSLIRKAFRFYPGHRRATFGIATAAFVSAQLEALVFVLIATTAALLTEGTRTLETEVMGLAISIPLNTALLAGAVGVIVSAGVRAIQATILARAAARVEADSRRKVVSAFAEADWEYQSEQRVGGLQAAAEFARSAAGLFGTLAEWVTSAVTLLVYVLTAVVVDPFAAAILIVFSLVLSAVILPLRSRTKQRMTRATSLTVSLGESISEAGQMALDIRAFHAWPVVSDHLDTLSVQLAKARTSALFLSRLVPVIYQAGGLLVVIAVMIVADVGSASIASLAATGLLLLRSLQYGQAVQRSTQQVAQLVPTVELMRTRYLSPPPGVDYGTSPLGEVAALELRNVSYTYPGAASEALHDFSETFHAGEMVGIAGPSGAGKSTLGQILLRLRQPTQGKYLANSRGVNDFTPESWSQQVSYVPQQPALLSASLFDNVAFYADEITTADVTDALAEAGLSGLVDSLPGGLDCLVGPGHRNLSGGQIQRVGIARALVRRPSVIVLDEPTSALDPESERAVHDGLLRLKHAHGRIVVVIAHRETTLNACDRVISLAAARV